MGERAWSVHLSRWQPRPDWILYRKFVTVQSQAKFQKAGIKCVAFWRLALNSYKNFKNIAYIDIGT